MGYGLERSRHEAPRRRHFDLLCYLTLALLTVVFACALLAPSSAFALFTRPSLRLITSTPAGPFSFDEAGAGGVAVDTEDDLWVGDGLSGLDEFYPAYHSPGNEFRAALTIVRPPEVPPTLEEHPTPPGSLAIDDATNFFYFTAEHSRFASPPFVEVLDNMGTFSRRWGVGEGAHIVIDNSTEPFDSGAGSVYVSSYDGTISKFDASGAPVNFEGCETCSSYVKGNQVTGTPNGRFEHESPGSIAVDLEGNLYVTNRNASEVDEYRPNGEFVRVFTGEETPGLGESSEQNGFGGQLAGVTVDPVSNHILVAVDHFNGTNGVVEEGAVDEFDAATGEFLHQITKTSVGGLLRSAFEMTVDSHGDLYVVDTSSGAVDVYGPGLFLPGLRLAEVGERTPTSAVLRGSVNPESLVNPEKSGLSDCHFEYVSESVFKETGFASASKVTCLPSASEIPADSNFHTVHAEIEGLVKGTTYRYRLVATTAGALGGTSESPQPAFTAPDAPAIDSTFATNLSSTFADLGAQIDPLGAATTYYFQYVAEAHYNPAAADPYEAGASVPTSPVGIGSGGPTGGAQENVLQHVGELIPGSTYHFRVVAANEIEGKAEIVDGPDETFTTLPDVVPGLPDNRSYELVTPPDRSGGSDMFGLDETNGEFFNGDVGQPSESGDGFLLETFSAFGSFPGSFGNVYVFSRYKAEWTYTSLASPSFGVQGIGDPVFDPANLSRVGIGDSVGSEVSEGGARKTSLVGSPGGPYTTLHVDLASHVSGGSKENTGFVGASHDLSHVVLESTIVSASKNDPLCAGAALQDEGTHVLCEWAGGYESVNGELKPELKLVNVTSTGSLLSRCGALLGAGAAPGSGSNAGAGHAHNAVSADGSRIILTAPDPSAENGGPGCWNGGTLNAPQLYMRSGGATVELSAPEAGVTDPTGNHSVTYVGASEDDSKVFFLTETWLTRNHPEGHDPELYECEMVEEAGKLKCKLTRISSGDPGASGAEVGADVNTVPAVSAEGSAVYFTAFGALAPGASQHKRPSGSEEEEVNLYRYDTANMATSYVATVSTRDYTTAGDFSISLDPAANWYTTPDGRYLLFASSRALTGNDTIGPCATLPLDGGNGNGHCDELYRYDFGAAESHESSIVCVSCNSSGASPVSNAEFARSATRDAVAGPVRGMSDSGSYVFFDTADALVSTDDNDTLDVYEWHNGRVSLISSGKDSDSSFFLGASPTASNVFFGTHANLVPQDTNSNGDIYDARICEPEAGNPCIKPPSGETAQCEGDACQSSLSAPIDATPGSLTFSGAGNALPLIPVVRPKSLTRSQKLLRTLKACKGKPRRKRVTCEAQARKRYGVKSKAGKAKRSVRAQHFEKSGGARK